jgi:predicted acyltransferase
METPAQSPRKERLESLDAFRGLTILGMVFVIAVAAGQYQHDGLPQAMSWFGSIPVSTWFHADVGFDLWMEAQEAKGLTADAIAALPEYQLRNIGCTFTDLIAPWFVFIVGACVPLSRDRRGGDWWKHVGSRTLMLIVAGVVYMSFVLRQVTWWWGVLQAIGVAYFMAALVVKVPRHLRWPVILGAGAVNLAMTELAPWWTSAFESGAPFGTLTNPGGDWFKPWIVHCQPWLSMSYGVMAMIGVQVGEALTTKDPRRIIPRCLIVGSVYTVLGYTIHKAGFATANYSLCFNKPDVSTSYAFFTAGLGALTFCGFYYLIDVLKIRRWAAPLNVFGVNPLLAYFLMIVMRRAFETLGINGSGIDSSRVGFFNRVTEANTTVYNWARLFGDDGQPAQWVLDFFHKGGYHGVMWGLIWTGCLWLIVLWCNRRELYWKL